MNLNELIGRLLMVGFDGQELTPDLAAFLIAVRPGGIILFKRNVGGGPRQVAGLIAACQDLARAEFGRSLLVAIDQEGGPVHRLEPPFSILPSQKEMARTLNPEQVRLLGETSGRELSAVGFNLNLAPVLDLVTDPQATFMSERSFGPDPDLAATLGLALIQGHAEHSVLTCAKHFPGIGDTYLDPHFELPSVPYQRERMLSRELLPFQRAMEHGLAAVMTSHVVYPHLDPEQPATFSSNIVTDLLRTHCGFSGLVLSDDLEMGAIIKNYSIGPAAVRTVLAGTDLVLVCRDRARVFETREALITAVQNRTISTARLESSASRLEQAWQKIQRPAFDAWKEVPALVS